jgi:hypothetical protein
VRSKFGAPSGPPNVANGRALRTSCVTRPIALWSCRNAGTPSRWPTRAGATRDAGSDCAPSRPSPAPPSTRTQATRTAVAGRRTLASECGSGPGPIFAASSFMDWSGPCQIVGP